MDYPEALFLMNRPNHRIFSYVGLNSREMMCKVFVMYRGAGSSFIRKDVLVSEIPAKLHVMRELPHVRDPNSLCVEVCGEGTLTVRIASQLEKISFKVVERLATEIIGCEYL